MFYIRFHASLYWFVYEYDLHAIWMAFNMKKWCCFYLAWIHPQNQLPTIPACCVDNVKLYKWCCYALNTLIIAVVCLLGSLEECNGTHSKYEEPMLFVVIYVGFHTSFYWFACECTRHLICVDFNVYKVCPFHLALRPIPLLLILQLLSRSCLLVSLLLL